MEVISIRHFFISVPLVALTAFVTRYIFLPQADIFIETYNVVGYLVFFFLINLPAVGFQFIENKYLWSKFLKFKDHLSFFGISVGVGIGLFSLGKW